MAIFELSNIVHFFLPLSESQSNIKRQKSRAITTISCRTGTDTFSSYIGQTLDRQKFYLVKTGYLWRFLRDHSFELFILQFISSKSFRFSTRTASILIFSIKIISFLHTNCVDIHWYFQSFHFYSVFCSFYFVHCQGNS